MHPDSCEEMDEARMQERSCADCEHWSHFEFQTLVRETGYYSSPLSGCPLSGYCNSPLSGHQGHVLAYFHAACEEFEEKQDDPNK